MANQIIPLRWEKPLRKSAVNTLDKVNELINFINNSSIHELSLVDSVQGREVITGTSTQLAQLEIFGESVQDGTPTPDNPVPVQVVGGRNLLDGCDGETTGNYPFNRRFNSNPLQFPRMLYAGESVVFSFDVVNNVSTNIGIIIIYADNTTESFYTATNGTTGRKSKTFTLPKNGTACGFYSVNEDLVSANYQLEVGGTATPYIPYGCIGLQTGETVTPIALQGHTLASLPDGTQDELEIDAAGVVDIAQRVTTVDMGELTWSYNATAQLFNASLPDGIRGKESGIHCLCSIYTAVTGYKPGSGGINDSSLDMVVNVGSAFYQAGKNLLVRDSRYTDAAAFKAAMSGVLLYYELATPATIELGTITPPRIPSGSAVEIVATLQPEFVLTWFTEQGLPLVVDDLKSYINSLI